MSKTTSITSERAVEHLTAFLNKTLRERVPFSPTYEADVYDRDANHPAGSIIIEGVVNLTGLARAILDHQAEQIATPIASISLAEAQEALSAAGELFGPERFVGANESSMRIFPRHKFPDRFRIEVIQGGNGTVMSPLRTEAARIALTVLEAAHSNGAPVSAEVARAMEALEELAQRLQIEAAAVADRAKLEAEAYAYYRASCLATDTVPAPDWATAKNLTKDVERDFIAIATTAREIHGGGSK